MTAEDRTPLDRVQEYLHSPEHQQRCRQYQAECDRMIRIASDLYRQLDNLMQYCSQNTVRRELASQNAYMHRGYYCPSPIFDIIVGNAKRGIILKRITSRSNPTHEFGFDSNNRLLWCSYFYNRKTVATEYLVYRDDTVYGIIVDSQHQLQKISEETYSNGKLTRYFTGLCHQFDDGPVCSSATCEEYGYDTVGLSTAKWHHYVQNIQQAVYRCDEFHFERTDGYLTSYSNNKGYTYEIRIRRKA